MRTVRGPGVVTDAVIATVLPIGTEPGLTRADETHLVAASAVGAA